MKDLTSQLSYYSPSGAAPIGGVIATLAMSIVGGVVLASVYAFVNYHDPILYFNVALSMGFGWALGWLVAKGVRVFHIRSAFISYAITFVAFIIAYIAHWIIYIPTVILDYSDEASSFDFGLIFRIAADLVQEPDAIWSYIQAFNETGIWSFTSSYSSRSDGIPVDGILLAIIWLTEGATILFFAYFAIFGEAKKPYSERQGKWLDKQILPTSIAFVEDADDFKNYLERGDFSALTTPLPVDADHEKYATVTLFPDSFESYVSVENVLTQNKKSKKTSRWFKRGAKNENNTPIEIVKYLKISPTTAQAISSALNENTQ